MVDSASIVYGVHSRGKQRALKSCSVDDRPVRVCGEEALVPERYSPGSGMAEAAPLTLFQIISFRAKIGASSTSSRFIFIDAKGQLTAERNDIPGAIRLLEQAATLAQQIHFNRGAAQVNAQLATFYKRAGNLPRAEIAARRCIDAHPAMQEVYEIPHHLAVQASIQAATGKRRVARETFETAELVVSTMLRNSPTVAVKTSVLSSMSGDVHSEKHFGLPRLKLENAAH